MGGPAAVYASVGSWKGHTCWYGSKRAIFPHTIDTGRNEPTNQPVNRIQATSQAFYNSLYWPSAFAPVRTVETNYYMYKQQQHQVLSHHA